MYKLHIYLVVFLFLMPLCATAQTDVEEERSSLRGLEGVGVSVNIEQNTAFADTQLVKIEPIQKQSIDELKNANIRVFSDREVRESIRIPVLYLHVNSLSTKTGIISFSITVSLYQPVKLVLNRDKQATASTWETSTVGIASYDKIGVIEQAALGMIRQFVDDFKQSN
jgi:hypothetical protein